MLPERGPFAIRARVLTPLGAGGSAFHADGVVEVDAGGRIAFAGPTTDWAQGAADAGRERPQAIDVRPLLLLPGMVDLHAHLPQLPTAGLGAGLDLLTWLSRYVFPLERRFDDAAAAAALAPQAFKTFASVGTTTLVAYAAVFAASTDGAFRAADAHGIRAVLGKVMMDRVTYDERIDPTTILDRSLRESEDLCTRWHGADDGRLMYAVTPRFAVSCTADMLRESAALAARTGAYWQTHVSEDPGEIAEVGRLFPEALDYVDVYERAGGLGARTILAHAVHLSRRELGRLVATSTHVAHCPASNLFLASGVMPLARYLDAGLSVGLGSDVSGGPDPSLFSVMRVGAYVQNALRAVSRERRPSLTPLDWLRLGTLEGACALGLDDRIGSLEPGKDADMIVVDAGLTAPVRHSDLPRDAHPAGHDGPTDAAFALLGSDDPSELMSRLIFRAHPEMVRAAWVRGRRLAGPGIPAEPSAIAAD
jgi:guanine deaminase